MNFIESRGNDGLKAIEVSFSEAILSPSASFGGLYIPKKIPSFNINKLQSYTQKNYKELAFDILNLFDIDIDKNILQDALSLYDKFDDKDNPIPVEKIGQNLFVSELYHGPTRAFKDMALQPFGHILSYLAQKENQNYLIMAATSGDTGPAALDTFRDKKNIKVVCLYPSGGTSDVQRLQMVTESGNNLKVIGINGNFDDAQNSLKQMLNSQEFKDRLLKDNIKLSAANSVNFGRIIFQIIYHFHSYIQLLKQEEISNGESINLVIPSGNFGNALGAYYAKKMGLKIDKILIASNENSVLTSLITTGIYDLREMKLISTLSPAMDILKSSNVERILYDKFGAKRTKELMDSLAKNNYYKLSASELNSLREDFDASCSDDGYALKTIASYYKDGYLMDPHTATCIKAYDDYKNKSIKTVLYSTAEWTKFSPTVANAIGLDVDSDEDALNKIFTSAKMSIHPNILSLFSKKIKHTNVVDKKDILAQSLSFLNLKN